MKRFEMIVGEQFDFNNRTCLCGKPNMQIIPKYVYIKGTRHKVLGRSLSVPLSFASIEIYRVKDDLKGCTVIGYLP